MDAWLVSFLIFFAAWLLQGVVGFGSALTSMPLLIGAVGLTIARPLGSIVAVATLAMQAFRYRNILSFSDVWRLSLMACVAVPIGIIGLDLVPTSAALTSLGIIILLYTLYSSINLPLPTMESRNWGIPVGFMAGLLSGAFNTGGPPIIMYGHAKKWEPEQFRGNLQAFFLPSAAFNTAVHIGLGNVDGNVLNLAMPSIVGGLLGAGAGTLIGRKIDGQRFRPLVLGLLLAIGVRLLLTA